MLIHEVAKLTGLSVRTLHYYHELGLVIPNQHPATGYREYGVEQLKTIEHIQFFKELGFTLKDIQAMLQNKQFNSLEAFQLQHRALKAKQEHLAKQIARIESLINNELKGAYTMSNDELNFNTKEYEQEAREKWGDEAVDDSIFRLNHLSEEEQTELKQKWNTIYTSLAKQVNQPVNHIETERLMSDYFTLLNTYFGKYDYNAFIGLGQLYSYDERFTANIDKFGKGLALYMSEAMASWGTKQLEK